MWSVLLPEGRAPVYQEQVFLHSLVSFRILLAQASRICLEFEITV